MPDSESSPVYIQIAFDLARRIAEGQLAEGEKISGRSLLASQYETSPETIRRALRRLADMKVVTIKSNSGVTILSADNAIRYIKGSDSRFQQQQQRQKISQLFLRQQEITKQLQDSLTSYMKTQESPSLAEQAFPNYEVQVPKGSPVIGKSIGAVRFWQATGATIVAIKRPQYLILSPGPYAEIYDGDILVFVGEPTIVDVVRRFVSGEGGEQE